MSGLLLAVASWIKLYPAYFAVILALRRGARGLSWFTGSVLLVGVLPVAALGAGRYGLMLQEAFFGQGMRHMEGQRFLNGRCAIMPTLWRLTGQDLTAYPRGLDVAWAGLWTVVLIAAYRRGQDHEQEQLWLSLAFMTGFLAKAFSAASRRSGGRFLRRFLTSSILST